MERDDRLGPLQLPLQPTILGLELLDARVDRPRLRSSSTPAHVLQRALLALPDANWSATTSTSLRGATRRAEQALRPAVITRKVCGGGNRTPRGADTQQVLASVLRTAQQRGLDSADLLATLLRAPTPIVSPMLFPVAASVN